MDWLNDITTAVKSAPSISSTPPKQENKPTPQTDPKPTSVKTDNMPQTETKTPEPKPSKSQDIETEPKTTSSVAKPKGSASDWLGLNDADDEDDEPASWMRAKSQQKVTSSIFMFWKKKHEKKSSEVYLPELSVVMVSIDKCMSCWKFGITGRKTLLKKLFKILWFCRPHLQVVQEKREKTGCPAISQMNQNLPRNQLQSRSPREARQTGWGWPVVRRKRRNTWGWRMTLTPTAC